MKNVENGNNLLYLERDFFKATELPKYLQKNVLVLKKWNHIFILRFSIVILWYK